MKDNKPNTQAVDTPEAATNEENKGGNSAGVKTFTQEEVNSLIAARVNELNDKNKSAIEEALIEYDRKAKLTQEEKEKEESTKREAEIREREEQITLRERRIEAQNMLLEKQIPIELVDFVVELDEKKTKDNVELLAKNYIKSVEDGVKNKLKGSPIEDFSNSNQKNETKKPVNSAF